MSWARRLGTLGAALALAACAGTSSTPAKGAVAKAAAVARVAGLPAGPVFADDVEVAPYDGAYAQDPRLPSLVTRIIDAARAASVEVRSVLAVNYPTGRGPLVRIDDAAQAPHTRPERLLVEGIRRPVVRIRTASLLAGAFAPEERMRPLLVHVALLAAAGDRAPPDWLLEGAAVELGGAFDRLLEERAIRGACAFGNEAELFAEDARELRSAARVRALRRVAKGGRPVLRYVEAWRRGVPEPDVLRALGIEDPLFLEAATETEQARAFEALRDDPLYARIGAARAALEAIDANAADAALTGVLEIPQEERTPRLWTEVALVRAEIAWLRREILSADADTERLIATPESVVRLDDALWFRVRVHRERGRDEEWLATLAELIAAFPTPGNAAGVLAELETGRLALDTAVISDLVHDVPGERARRAGLLAESAGPESVGALRLLARDPHPLVRSSALTGLALQSGSEALPELVRGTRDRDASVRRAALLLLEKADPETAREHATRLRTDPDMEIRAEALRILAPAPPPRAKEKPAAPAQKPRPKPASLPPPKPRRR